MYTHRRPPVLRTLALILALLTGLSVALGAVLSEARAQSAPQYTFTRVADSVEDGFDPNNFGCAAITTPTLNSELPSLNTPLPSPSAER